MITKKMRRILVLQVASFAFTLGAPAAHAVITTPIDAGTPSVPPIVAWPLAGDTPPSAEAINDPIELAAKCGDWQLQSNYGGQWPAASTWWEYQCTFVQPPPCSACVIEATWSPSVWTDFFYWDGVRPVFYGEYYVAVSPSWGGYCQFWWNEPTSCSRATIPPTIRLTPRQPKSTR
jgi:hypothetical protein